jgi:hypothetical protein
VKRREFVTLLGGAAAIASSITSARLAHAQVPRQTVRVGIATIQPRTAPLWVAFEQRLKQLGYTEGENLTIEFIDLNGLSFPKIPSGAESRDKGESAHHLARCLPSSICLGRLSPT